MYGNIDNNIWISYNVVVESTVEMNDIYNW